MTPRPKPHKHREWTPRFKRGARYPWCIECSCGDRMDTTLRIVTRPAGAKPKTKEPFE